MQEPQFLHALKDKSPVESSQMNVMAKKKSVQPSQSIRSGKCHSVLHYNPTQRASFCLTGGRFFALRLYGEIDAFETVLCLESKLSHLSL